MVLRSPDGARYDQDGTAYIVCPFCRNGVYDDEDAHLRGRAIVHDECDPDTLEGRDGNASLLDYTDTDSDSERESA